MVRAPRRLSRRRAEGLYGDDARPRGPEQDRAGRVRAHCEEMGGLRRSDHRGLLRLRSPVHSRPSRDAATANLVTPPEYCLSVRSEPLSPSEERRRVRYSPYARRGIITLEPWLAFLLSHVMAVTGEDRIIVKVGREIAKHLAVAASIAPDEFWHRRLALVSQAVGDQ